MSTTPSAAKVAIEARIEVRPKTEKLLERLFEYQDRLSGFRTYFECSGKDDLHHFFNRLDSGSSSISPKILLLPDEWDRTWHRTLLERNKAFAELVVYIARLEADTPLLWEDS